MKLLRILRYRVRALLRRGDLDREMDEEMRFHLDMAARDHEAAGLPPEEARRRARLEFGGLERQREEMRDARGLRWLEDFVQDVRYGLRLLRRSPVFTAVAVVSLGLGIGANTAVFSLVNAVLLRSLPVPNPQELRILDWTALAGPMPVSMTGSLRPSEDKRMQIGDAVSYPAFSAVRQGVSGRAEVFGFMHLLQVTVTRAGEASIADGLMVTDNFFDGLAVPAELGRVFTASDPESEGAGWVVLSHAWWLERFGGDPGATGQALTLNGKAFTVIGVLPPGVRGVQPGEDVDFYVSTASQPELAPQWGRAAADRWWVIMMARLAPGVSDEQFRAVAGSAFVHAVGDLAKEPGLIVGDGRGGLAGQRDRYRRPLLILLGIVGIVILTACANLAGLSLARATAREHEFRVRPALGAGRGRLLRQSLTESLLLGLLGAAVGVALAVPGKATLARLLVGSPIDSQGLHYDTALDLGVLAFTLALALLASLLAGLLPALRSARGASHSSLQERGIHGSRRRVAARGLIVGQVALSLVLLVGAGLFGRTLLNLVRVDPGFRTDHLLLFRLDPAAAGYASDRTTAYYDEVSGALERIPGVRSVALSQMALLSGWMSGGSFFTLPAHPPAGDDRPQAHRLTVGDAYFATMEIPVLVGRGFERTDDAGAERVVIVNETFVERYLEGAAPVGEILRVAGQDWAIVGVSADARYTGIKEDIPPTVYFPVRQVPLPSAFFTLRTDVPPLSVVAAARRAVAGVDPGVPLSHVETQRQIRDSGIAQERLFAFLCGGLAGLALLICCVGLFGLMAYDVARRTGEIGVRVALGATSAQIARPILGEAVAVTLAGVLVGLGLVAVAVRAVRSQLYGVAPDDPLAVGAGTLLLLMVAVLAVGVPALRASRIDPADALRTE